MTISLLQLSDGSVSPRSLRTRGWFVVSLFLLAVFVCVFARTLLQSPTRTPLLIVSTSYAPPWDLNPCSNENVAALKSLDRHNLTVRKLEEASAMAKGQWGEFEDVIAQLDHAAASDKPLLLYINLHGAVDQGLRPCFLFQDSEALDTKSWLPLQSLIDHIANVVKKDRSVVLFLESGRQSGPLPSELPDNLFAHAVRKLVDSHFTPMKLNRLTVIVSATTNIGSADPRDGLADPFTRFLSEALAGLCDQRIYGGNGNQYVELGELNRYVQEKTKTFALQNRGASQSTMLCSSSDTSLQITWAGSSSRRIESHPLPTATTQTLSDIENAWRVVDALQKKHPWRNQPAEWSELIQVAVGMEEVGFAGRDRILRMPEFKQRFQQLERGMEVTTHASENSMDDLDYRIAQNDGELWKALSESPSLQNAIQLCESNNEPKEDRAIATLPFLHQACKHPELAMWRAPDTLKAFAAASRKLELVRQQWCQLPELKAIAEKASQLEHFQRSIEDRMLANLLDESIKADIYKFDTSIDPLQRWTTWFLIAIRAHERAIHDIATLYRACDVVDSIASDSAPTLLSSRIEKITEGLLLNSQVLRNASQFEAIPQTFVDITPELTLLKRELTIRWQDLLQAKGEITPSNAFAIQELLRSGFLPNHGESLENAIQMRLATRKLLAKPSNDRSTLHMQTTSQPTTLDLSHRSQIAIARLITETSLQLTSGNTNHSGDRSAQTNEKLIAIACDAVARDAVSGSSEDHAVASSIARIFASLCLDSDCSRLVRGWNALQSKRRLVRSSYRVMQDFWKEPMIRSQPYFVTIANALLDEATRDGSDDLSLEFGEALQSLASRKEAVLNGLLLQAVGAPTWLPDSETVIACAVKPGAGIASIPSGTASLRLINKDSFAEIGGIESIAIGPGMQPRTVPLHAPKLPDKRSENAAKFVARLLFRGHVFESNHEIVADFRNVSVSQVAEPGLASVVIHDQRDKRRARTLILDCSASMIEPQQVEGTASITPPNAVDTSKLSAARRAMSDILNRWRDSTDLIGVTLFGHRVAMGNATQGTLFQNRYYSTFPFPQSLRAFEDVESILPVGRFADAEFAAVMNRLDLLLPWGQTPLYLALMHAMEQTPNFGNGVTHDVIVISDGRNYQFNPTPDKNISIDEVIDQAKRLGVRIHIIGFGVPASELAEATQQYRRLADESGGTATMQVANAIELVEKIDTLVQPETFVVRLATGESWQAPCNQPITIPTAISNNTPVWIDYGNHRRLVPVSPRSAIRMTIGADERLICADFTTEGLARRTSILNVNNAPSLFQLGSYQPRLQESSVVWHLSLLRSDEEVAQRPKYLWAEVDPVLQEEPILNSPLDDCYFFADSAWTADAPIPVLRFETKDWPMEAKSGRVQFWFTDVAPRSFGEIELAGAPSTKVSMKTASQDGTLAGTDIRYEVHMDRESVLLVFFHATDAIQVHSLAPFLEVNGASVRVERQYRTSQRMSIHRFAIASGGKTNSAGKPSDLVRFQILDVNDIKRNGLRLAAPVEISLPPLVVALPSSAPPVLRR